MAGNLTKSASMWEEHESDAVEKMDRVSDDSQ
jgi:hypothetical protein